MEKKSPKATPLKLSLCMIVKNEATNLGICLKDVHHVVDEIIVVDTGSTDETVKIAEQYGADVHYFPWISDFSAARNESIRHAKGDYILWLDADDRLETTDQEKLLRMKAAFSTLQDEAHALIISCRNLKGEAAIYYQVRIFPNVEGILFEGAVHENLLSALHRKKISIKNKNITIIHTGYGDPRSLEKKLKRNLSILQNTTDATNRQPGDHYLMAKCYFGLREYQQCLQNLQIARLAGKGTSFYKPSYTMLADCYLQLGQGDRAVQDLHRAIKEYPTSGYLHNLLGSSLTLIGRYQEAMEYLQKARELGIEVETSPVLATVEYRRLYYLARCMEGLDRIEEATAAFENALVGAPFDIDILRSYGFHLTKQGRFEDAFTIFKTAYENASTVETDILLALARFHLAYGQIDDTIRLYSEILDSDPRNIDALLGMVRAGSMLGDFDRMVSALEGLMESLHMSSDKTIRSHHDLVNLIQKIASNLEAANASEHVGILKELAANLKQIGASSAHEPIPQQLS